MKQPVNDISSLQNLTAQMQSIYKSLDFQHIEICRLKLVINMYKSGHTIDDIWKTSGFKSRSSVFRILNQAGVELNRGHAKGPLGSRKNSDESKGE